MKQLSFDLQMKIKQRIDHRRSAAISLAEKTAEKIQSSTGFKLVSPR